MNYVLHQLLHKQNRHNQKHRYLSFQFTLIIIFRDAAKRSVSSLFGGLKGQHSATIQSHI